MKRWTIPLAIHRNRCYYLSPTCICEAIPHTYEQEEMHRLVDKSMAQYEASSYPCMPSSWLNMHPLVPLDPLLHPLLNLVHRIMFRA